MKCEICKTIERLGLDDSAHDLWHCTDAGVATTALRHSRSYVQQVARRIRLYARSHCPHYRMLTLVHRRRQLVTLSL